VTAHPQGKHLTALLQSLGKQVDAERGAAVEELDTLREKIEHIKEIVLMQQSYANVMGVKG
jgi:hypothetical protein